MPNERRAGSLSLRAALLLALVTVAGWYAVVNGTLPHTLGDEMYHVPAIRDFAREAPLGRALPMLPTYHRLLSWPARVAGGELWFLRLLEALIAAGMLVLAAVMVRWHAAGDGGERLLLLAWNPLVVPFYALVYTDLLSLALVLAGLLALLRRWGLVAAVALLAACLVRQTNVVWIVFLVVWRLSAVAGEAPRAMLGALGRTIWREALWLPGLVAGGVAYLLLYTDVFDPAFFENQARFNVAQYHSFGLVLAVCWLPIWGGHLVRHWRDGFGPALARPWTCALLTAAVGFVTLVFANDHPWNQELEFLHNWPLRLMEASVPVRILVSLLIVAFVAVQAHWTWRQPDRGVIALTWLFALLFLAPHYPVDYRYYIIPLVLLDWFTPYAPGELRRMAAWYLVLTIGVGAFVALRPGPYGGL